MKKHIMLDLETMGTSSYAAILSIGAIEFNEANLTDNSFYANVNLASSVKAGGVIGADTVMWWLKQSEEARHALLGDVITINRALRAFKSWVEGIGDIQEICIWGNGATFDNVILRNAYLNEGTWDAPWRYANDRCYRTIKEMFPEIKLERLGTAHNALDDAISQANHLLAINHSGEGITL